MESHDNFILEKMGNVLTINHALKDIYELRWHNTE